MQKSTLYSQLAPLYDSIYHWKDYDAESQALVRRLLEEGVPEGGRVLDVACGTGMHIERLRAQFDVAGFDLNEEMLKVARARLSGVPLMQGDMRELQLAEPFDALLCLFSSIGHLHGRKETAKAAARFHDALVPGGVLLVEPWVPPDAYREGLPSMQSFDAEDLKIARLTVAKRRGDLSILDMHWLIARRDGDVEHVIDHEELWMCPRDEFAAIFEEVGFEVRIEPHGLMPGRGLLIGRRRG
jgi:SAM-dependent methyltransferase